MSDQVATTPAGAPPAVGSKPYDLHKCAVDAEKALEQLATELGKADADPQVIKAVGAMADATRRIATAVARMPGGMKPAPAQPAQPRETMQSATDQLAASARQPGR